MFTPIHVGDVIVLGSKFDVRPSKTRGNLKAQPRVCGAGPVL